MVFFSSIKLKIEFFANYFQRNFGQLYLFKSIFQNVRLSMFVSLYPYLSQYHL